MPYQNGMPEQLFADATLRPGNVTGFLRLFLLSILLLGTTGLSASEEAKEGGSASPMAVADKEDLFMLGRSFFSIPWVVAPSATTARDGLGPLFNANTCMSCHQNDGSAQTIDADGQPLRSLVFKLAQPAQHADKPDKMMNIVDPVYGSQIAINGTGAVLPEATTHVQITHRDVTFPDGTKQRLTAFEPYLSDLNYGALADDTQISLRQPIALHGIGLVAEVADDEIAAWADPDDNNHDGISGRINRVYDRQRKTMAAGRFGWKAGQPSVLQQVADAAAHDMGLTNPLFPKELCSMQQVACTQAPKGRPGPLGSLDLPMLRLQAITHYVRQLPAPAPPTLNAAAARGQALFQTIGCASCHRAILTTRDGQSFAPYSDFLLHDMGAALSDARPEYDALPSEWRTAPLWGLGERLRAGQRFLHDARAASPLEAVLWHGGEAKQTRQRFEALPKSQRDDVIAFLEQL